MESLYAAKTYKVEYGSGTESSWNKYAINCIMDRLCDGVDSFDDEVIRYSNILEISVESFEGMLAKTKEISEAEFQELYEEYKEYSEAELTKDDFQKTIQTLYDDADKDDGFIHLSWH